MVNVPVRFFQKSSDFVDAADDNGNIKNSQLELQYLNQIDNACKKARITAGAVYPFSGGTGFSHKFNFLNPSKYLIDWHGTIDHNHYGIQGDAVNGNGTGYGSTNLSLDDIDVNNFSLILYKADDRQANNFDIGKDSGGGFTVSYVLGWIVAYTVVVNNNVAGVNGLYITTLNNNSEVIYAKGNKVLQNSFSPFPSDNSPFTIARGFDGINTRYSNTIFPFVGITNGLSEAKIKALSHDIYVAQRMKGRA